jgi:UDP-glucose:(heptosyl)LPS alpha-1,3-glucosyltransferase
MKLGLVRRGYSSSGGAERYLVRFAEGLVQAGHEVALFGSREWPADVWKWDFVKVAGHGPREFADALARARPRERCDLVFSLERVWECDAYRAGDGAHRAWLERRRRFEPAWKAWARAWQRKHREILALERAVFAPDADRVIIANSRMVAGEISALFHTPPGRVHVIHNGLPASFAAGMPAFDERRAATRSRLRIHDGDCAVLFVGSGWERKGLRFAMEAVNRARNAKLMVAGKGKRHGLPASGGTLFLDRPGDVRELMAAADVFLLPTIYDPFSNASLEAFAAGLPVITTTANGFAEIMRPGSDGTVLARPDDVAAITSAIEKWSAEETPELRAGRRLKASRYTVEENVRKTVELLGSLRSR